MSRNLDMVLLRLLLSFFAMLTALAALLDPEVRVPALCLALTLMLLRTILQRY